jgi:hypothetical protein
MLMNPNVKVFIDWCEEMRKPPRIEPLVIEHDYNSYKHLIGNRYHQYLNKEEIC